MSLEPLCFLIVHAPVNACIWAEAILTSLPLTSSFPSINIAYIVDNHDLLILYISHLKPNVTINNVDAWLWNELPCLCAFDLAHVPTANDCVRCVICMGEFKIGDALRFLPCVHIYHKECIDDWLMRSFTCPSCMEPVDAAILTTYEWGTVQTQHVLSLYVKFVRQTCQPSLLTSCQLKTMLSVRQWMKVNLLHCAVWCIFAILTVSIRCQGNRNGLHFSFFCMVYANQAHGCDWPLSLSLVGHLTEHQHWHVASSVWVYPWRLNIASVFVDVARLIEKQQIHWTHKILAWKYCQLIRLCEQG